MTLLLGTVAVAALVSSGLLWQKLSAIQEQLARQSADSGALAIEARTMARQAEELVRDTAARLSVAEARVSEVALQRSQLEELMQSLSRSRDENLVVDIDAGLRLAQHPDDHWQTLDIGEGFSRQPSGRHARWNEDDRFHDTRKRPTGWLRGRR